MDGWGRIGAQARTANGAPGTPRSAACTEGAGQDRGKGIPLVAIDEFQLDARDGDDVAR
jgi:hypothetical protein